ncbi:MAG: hypothetical protein R2796_00060 [Chitinophagaceae bacterium]|nr:hypothetical protein [Chitinophagaceae bacterium]HQU57246.1 hypothetical protein [Chitinophagaceae bacterium]HQV06479.1 hypothetical protein [Chitinophagaceae bacterium]
MKQNLHISAFFDEPEFLQSLVERLAYRRYALGFENEKVPAGLKALETSSTEAYVSGTVGIETTDPPTSEKINMPFITCFLFTCIKGYGDPYKLIWSTSLS